jgi:hypothetical protein
MREVICAVAEDWDCLAPANVYPEARVKIRTKCFACGELVCRCCSRIRKWYDYGKQRICLNCIEEEERWRKLKNQKS